MPNPTFGPAAKVRETLVGFSANRQADIVTPVASAGIISFLKLNASFANPTLNTEDNAQEIGKPNEFPTEVFNTSWDVKGSLEKYLGADFAAWAFAFALGHVVKSGASPNLVYACTPLDPVLDGIELPYFTYAEQIRPGANSVLDHAAIGCAIEDLTLAIGSGPGRTNYKLTANFSGSGKFADPSGIVIPAATPDILLPSASLACSINGIDYVSAKNIASLTATYKNNLQLDQGFFPGSGFLTSDPASGAVRGRIECGDREIGLQFVARFVHNSDELTKLKAQTSGTAVFSLTHDANNSLQLTYNKVQFAVVELGDTNGIVTVQVTVKPLYDTSASQILTAVCKCGTDNIAQLAA